MLRGLFKKCYVDQTFLQDGVYDWSQPTPPSHPHDSPNQSQTEPSPPRSHKKIPKTYTNTNSIEILEVKSNAPPPVSIPINTKKRKDHSSDEIDVQNKKKLKTSSMIPPRMTLRPRRRSASANTPPHEIIEISSDDVS